MKKNKTWVRSKEQLLICGYCEVCNKDIKIEIIPLKKPNVR